MIDTNVLVYSTVSSSPWHQEAKKKLTALVDEGIELCLTPQIAREYLVVLTRGDIFERRFTTEEVLGELEVILPVFAVLDETEETVYYLRNLACFQHLLKSYQKGLAHEQLLSYACASIAVSI